MYSTGRCGSDGIAGMALILFPKGGWSLGFYMKGIGGPYLPIEEAKSAQQG